MKIWHKNPLHGKSDKSIKFSATCRKRAPLTLALAMMLLAFAVELASKDVIAEENSASVIAIKTSAQVDEGLKLLQKNTTESLRDAHRLFQKAAKENNPVAEYNLGLLYLNGRGVQKNIDIATNWLRRAAGHGYVDAQFDLSQIEIKQKNYADAAVLLQSAADAGHIISAYNLGVMYAEGQGVPRNDKMAVQYFERAAKSNFAKAQHNLGKMYWHGTGVSKDPDKARTLFLAAMKEGDLDATATIAEMHRMGAGFPVDLKKSASLYEMSAKQGHAHSQFMIGLLYGKGEGVIKNEQTMCYWLEQSSERGKTEAANAKKRLCERNNLIGGK